MLETLRGLVGEMGEGIRVVLRAIWTTSLVLKILLSAASLCWLAIGVGALLSGASALFLPLIVWVVFTVLMLSFIGDVFGRDA